MSADRYYSAGTKEALYMLSRGFCYEPGCKERVMRVSSSGWHCVAIIAHIHGLKHGSARWLSTMTDKERNSFRNLILLCKKHSDIVDNLATVAMYTPVLLVQWKKDREGELADELGTIDWVTQESLQEMMAKAVVATNDKILNAVEKVEGIRVETLTYLKTTVLAALNRPYLDAESVASLEYSANVLKNIPDYVPMLHRSAAALRSLPDDSMILHQSARDLKGLSDSADILWYAAKALKDARLHDLMDRFDEVDSTVASLLRATGELNNISSVVRELRELVGTLDQTASDLPKMLPAVPIGQPYRVDKRSAKSGLGTRPWNWFWWGVGLCAVFVVVVLILWAHISGHK